MACCCSLGRSLCRSRSSVPDPSGVRVISTVVEPGATSASPSHPQLKTIRRGGSTSLYWPIATWSPSTSSREVTAWSRIDLSRHAHPLHELGGVDEIGEYGRHRRRDSLLDQRFDFPRSSASASNRKRSMLRDHMPRR